MAKNPTTVKGWHKKWYWDLSVKQQVYAKKKYGLTMESPMQDWTQEIKADIRTNGNRNDIDYSNLKQVEAKLNRMAGF